MTTQRFRKIVPIIAIFTANGLVYGLNSLYFGFIQFYLEKYHPPITIGILLAIGPFVSIIAPIFWGIRTDKAKYKNTILAIIVAGSTLLFFLIKFNQSFWWLFFVFIGLMFFMSPFGGLLDLITLEYVNQTGFPYGPIRLMGTFVFGVMPMILSVFTARNINLIFYAYLIIAVICVVSILLMPKIKGHSHTKTREKKKLNIKPIITNKKLILITFMMFIAQFVWGYYNNFFPTYITNDLGFPQWVWGVNIFVTVLGEIPFFIFYEKLFSRIGIRKLLLFSIILSILRYVALALIANAPLLLTSGMITGVSVTVFTYCGSMYILSNMQPEIIASSQTIMYAVGSSVPRVLAGVLGGVMTSAIGVKNSLLICAGFCTTMLLVYIIFIHKDNSKEFN
ncbi:MAG: MFS transporter [Oscillospiraceae bacterium]|nr:MFS transporter [Oscillospiraceae bacterium]